MTDVYVTRAMLDHFQQKINLESTYTVQHLKDILNEVYGEAKLQQDIKDESSKKLTKKGILKNPS